MTLERAGAPRIGRRGLFIGAGAAALAGTALLTGEDALAATSPPGDGSAPASGKAITFSTSIASPAKSGYNYRSVCMYDFEPFDPGAAKTWGNLGIYSATVATAMRATCELPASARLREVEFYVYNNSATVFSTTVWLYVPGTGTVQNIGSAAAPIDASGIVATMVSLASDAQGPYPAGARILVGGSTPSSGLVQINGARLGFTEGSGEAGLLAAPLRAYDSRTSGGKLTAASTRTITLPTSVLPAGVSGVLLNVTAVGATKAGFLKVYSGAASAPSASSINYAGTGVAVANGMTVAVSNTRTIKVYASSAVHVVVDITGTVS